MTVKRGRVFVVSAPSGAGKSTLIKALMDKMGGIGFSVSHTTRAPRKGEKDGVHYHFVTREEFQRLVAAGAFVEWAEVHGNLYGTSRAALDVVQERGDDVILDIDVQGAMQVAGKLPEAVTVFVMPPSLEELEKRLKGRNKDSEEVIATRVKNAAGEMDLAVKYMYTVTNEVFDRALRDFECVVRAERLRNL